MKKDIAIQIQKYLDNHMSTQERNAFEERLEYDEFLASEFKEHKKISDDMILYKKEMLKQELYEKTIRLMNKEKRTIPLYATIAAIAASLLLFSILSVSIFKNAQSQQSYPLAEINKKLSPPNYNLLGDNEEKWLEALNLFDRKEYSEAKERFVTLSDDPEVIKEHAYEINIYLGYCYHILEEYDKAINQYQAVPETYLKLFKDAKWYTAFSYFEKKDYQNAKILFEEIANSDSHKKQAEAQKIIDLINQALFNKG